MRGGLRPAIAQRLDQEDDVMTAIALILSFLLAACSHPHRFDAMSIEEARAKQKACLDAGKPPPECRP